MPAFESGNIASMIGIEGLHQLDGSIAAIREVYELGVRYITLTHNCNNVFATSASHIIDGGVDTGLSSIGSCRFGNEPPWSFGRSEPCISKDHGRRTSDHQKPGNIQPLKRKEYQRSRTKCSRPYSTYAATKRRNYHGHLCTTLCEYWQPRRC